MKCSSPKAILQHEANTGARLRSINDSHRRRFMFKESLGSIFDMDAHTYEHPECSEALKTVAELARGGWQWCYTHSSSYPNVVDMQDFHMVVYVWFYDSRDAMMYRLSRDGEPCEI